MASETYLPGFLAVVGRGEGEESSKVPYIAFITNIVFLKCILFKDENKLDNYNCVIRLNI